MSISRRAIIHIGGKKREQIPQRILRTKTEKLFHNTPDDNFYFTIDLDKEENKTELIDDQINDLLEPLVQRRPKDLRKVKKINIQISTEDEHKLIQKKLNKQQQNKILKLVKHAKKTIKKKKHEKEKRKTMGLSKILVECEMDIEYYNNIKKIFTQFEKKFYIQTDDPKHKYNPFKFSLNSEYNTPLEYSNDVESIGRALLKWEDINDNNTKEPKYNLAKEFVQIMKDAPRNVIKYQNENNNLSFGQDPHSSEFFYYFSQLSMFVQYFYFEHDKENTKKFFNHLDKSPYKDAEFYNNYIIEHYIKHGEINEGAFQSYVAEHLRDEVERKDIGDGIYIQADLQGFLGILLATSSPDDKKYNIIDAAALYTYIYKKQGLHTFFNNVFSSIDNKAGHKHMLKIMSIFDLVDPDLFSELFDRVTTQAKENGDEKFWYKRLGETYIQNTTTFDDKKNSPWLISEKLKYDIFHDSSKKTLAEVIGDIKKEPKDNLNKPHEALIETYDKTADDITEIITITNNNPFVESKHYFSDGDTKLEMIHSFIKALVMELWSFVIWSLHSKNGNDSFHLLNSYYKYLYKYGITGWILFMAIHLKNMKTSIHLSKDTKEIYNFKKVLEKIKDGTAEAPLIEEFFIPTEDQQLRDHYNIAKRHSTLDVFYAFLFSDRASPFFIKGKQMGREYDFQHNVFLNPLTTNIKETYDKHFDFCIDHLKNIHGSIKTFETEFDKLYNRSLILYKNGYMKEDRLAEIKKTHKGITIVDKITDIWNKHKNDNRINFEKSKEHPGEKLKGIDKGWLGNVKHDLLRNALDGVYHVCYNTFMKDVSKIMKPFVSSSKGKGKCPNIPSLWPRNSGRPFIFVNKLHGDGGYLNSKLKRSSFFDEKKIKKKLLTGVISTGCLPNYWFNTKNMFTEEDIAKNKLLVEFEKMKPQNGISGIIEWNIVEEKLRLFCHGGQMPPARAGSESSESSESSISSMDSISSIDSISSEDTRGSTGSDSSFEDLGSEMQDHATEEANRLAEEQLAAAKKVAEDIDELTKEMNEAQRKQDRINDILAQERRDELPQKDDSGDDEQPPPPPKKTKQLQALTDLGLEIDPVKMDGDCLFETFRRFLKKNNIEPSVQKIRDRITDHITRIDTADDGSQTGPWRETYEDIILETKNEDPPYEKLYKNRDDYILKMKKVLVEETTAGKRAAFGDEMEISAFEALEWGGIPSRSAGVGGAEAWIVSPKKFRVQILKWENKKLMKLRDFVEEDLFKPNVLTIFNSGLHYQSLKTFLLPESAGSVEQPSSSKVSDTMPDPGTVTHHIPKNVVALRVQIKDMQTRVEVLLQKSEKHKQEAIQCKRKGDRDEAMRCLKRKKMTEKHIEVLKERQKKLIVMLKSIQHQQGGSNNVYINKCKNHRHKKTRKFRLKLKEIGNWTHVNKLKKKKYTRRKY